MRNILLLKEAVLVGVIIFSCSGVMTSAEGFSDAAVDYAAIYSKAADSTISSVSAMGGDTYYLQYALYDMDQDGYLDFLIQRGTCDADMVYQVYTTDGSNCIYLGDIPGAVSLYENLDGSGIITYWAKQWVERLYAYTAEDGGLMETCIFEGNNENYAVQHEELASRIVTRLAGEGFSWVASDTEDMQLLSEYVFPYSDTGYLSEAEVRSKDADELAIGRNEIYARHGYIFQDPVFKEHFAGTSWYRGTLTGDQFDASVFNEYENANLGLILQVEEELANGAAQSAVNYTGSYIDGTDSDYNHVIMSQDGGYVSYEWYTGDEYVCGENGLTINEDGSVWGTYWNFWFESDGTLKAHSGVGGAENAYTFWKLP